MVKERSRLLSILAALLLLAAPIHAEEEEEVLGIETLSTLEIQQVSSSGADVLGSIAAARTALKGQKRIDARRHVMHARKELGVIAHQSPSMRLQDPLDNALHQAATGGNPDLMPIYEELDASKKVVEFADVRASVDKAKAATTPEAVEDALVEASAEVVYTEIDLPIHETYARLARAYQNIQSLNFGSADAALAEAEEHVNVIVAAAAAQLDAAEEIVED